jgi:hypothetical protein
MQTLMMILGKGQGLGTKFRLLKVGTSLLGCDRVAAPECVGGVFDDGVAAVDGVEELRSAAEEDGKRFFQRQAPRKTSFQT